jgi:hypothetical protein
LRQYFFANPVKEEDIKNNKNRMLEEVYNVFTKCNEKIMALARKKEAVAPAPEAERPSFDPKH